MQPSAREAWKRILDEAQQELPDHTIRTWLEPTEAIALEEGRLVVGAPEIVPALAEFHAGPRLCRLAVCLHVAAWCVSCLSSVHRS